MRLEEFDYHLPKELIAQCPAANRDKSRLLHVSLTDDRLEDRVFSDIVDYLNEKDVLVLNETKVIPARLFGHKETGAKVELFLLKRLHGDTWETLVRPGRKIHVGDTVLFSVPEIKAEIVAATDSGGRIVSFVYDGIWEELLDRIGTMPLPPYIKEYRGDMERYQTVYAEIPGSVAAPTAGLHFTPELLKKIEAKGVKIAKVNLNVGLGTFRPLEEEYIEDHKMHAEYYEVSEEAAAAVNAARDAGGRVIAVGTTSTRTLETVAAEDGRLKPAAGWTDAYIYPGYRFKLVDGLITNFHLPKSSLLLLVSALAGREKIFRSYEHAVAEKYRFFSFGDAMLIL
ncbi:MAG TPA: tRNA preQ1(34) S-adenosylmethionine ribosyltransferase-isomerase QueA [Clostridiales bacterium]|nr:tRNA preQ1(34) S-adenosylmethionine ribosyltransferase-isomerase QueA [Clostridiales bacterium]